MDKFYLLDTDLVLKIYRELMEKYNSNAEIRDIKLLESAIYGVKNYKIYNDNSSIYDLAAAYCFYLCKNHAFVDGNKRIAFFVMAYFLRYHDYKIIADSEDSISMVKKVAQGKIKINGISDWLKDNTISNINKFN